jgi:hypothetical protein
MNELLLDFNKKVREINHYFRLVKFLDDKQHIDGFRITTEQQATLKANCYLLLYNLIESSIIEGLDAIFADINQQNIAFECLNDNYKKIWLEYKYQLVSKAKKSNCKNFSRSYSEIIDDLAVFKILSYTDKTGVVYEDYKGYLKTLEVSSEVSGNLDARKIRELSESYGFFVPEKCVELLIIKNFRNHLAHGEKTFSEIGKEKSVPELITINVRVILYLRAVLKNISNFINNKQYLKLTD